VVGQVFYYNQAMQYPAIKKDYKNVQRHVAQVTTTDKAILCALDSLPQFRRFGSVEDTVNNGDMLPAIGLASLAAVNFEEDLKDVKAAVKQVKAKFTGEAFKPAYDYKNYQHPFSFFRGTLIEKFANPDVSNNKELAQKLLKMDRTVVDTKFGKHMLHLLGAENPIEIETAIKDIGHTAQNPLYVKAVGYKNVSAFADITARAMKRVPLIGIVALSLFEVPKILKSLNHDDTITQNTVNLTKQTLKSGINVVSIATSIAYGGAIGAKKFGPSGSLIGMGVGAIIGSAFSKEVQAVIS
jgi:hypothetical protein